MRISPNMQCKNSKLIILQMVKSLNWTYSIIVQRKSKSLVKYFSITIKWTRVDELRPFWLMIHIILMVYIVIYLWSIYLWLVRAVMWFMDGILVTSFGSCGKLHILVNSCVERTFISYQLLPSSQSDSGYLLFQTYLELFYSLLWDYNFTILKIHHCLTIGTDCCL